MVLTVGHVAGAEDAAMKEVVDFDIRYAQKLYGVDARRRLARTDGHGAGDVSDDEARDREDERRGREDRRHADPDHDDDREREVGRSSWPRRASEPGPGRRQGRQPGRRRLAARWAGSRRRR